MSAPIPCLPQWVRALQPTTAAKAEEARRYVEHLRQLHRIETGRYDDRERQEEPKPYRATRRLLDTDERRYFTAAAGLSVWNDEVMQ